jgi:hypothetical protein
MAACIEEGRRLSIEVLIDGRDASVPDDERLFQRPASRGESAQVIFGTARQAIQLRLRSIVGVFRIRWFGDHLGVAEARTPNAEC